MMDLFDTLKERGLLHSCSFAEDGNVLSMSTALRQQLGYSTAQINANTVQPLTQNSLTQLQQLFLNTNADYAIEAFELTFLDQNHLPHCMLATGMINQKKQQKVLKLVCINLQPTLQRLTELENANQVMSEMLYSARVAYWCIEWDTAIDLQQSPDEIVQQVFETPSHWRMCNAAMREVYEMPSDVIFNQQAVRLYWPRSAANEEFVRHLIQRDFCVDGALSVDRRHDGSLAYVENDVRAHIEHGKMSRMWGSIYDVSQEFNLQQDAEQRIHALRQVFDAVPDAVVVVDEHFHPQWRNAAFEQYFGIIQGAKITHTLMQSALMERAWQSIELPNLQGQTHAYHVHCSTIHIQKNLTWTVVVLRLAINQPAEYELYP